MKTIFNKLMSIIFSKTTPFQLMLVSVFGFVFGFLPGFSYSPLLFVLVLFLVLILRVNIGVFILISLIAKIISYPLEFISFGLGKFLLGGFLQPIFKAAVNTPVLAYAGFDYYLVAGAFVLSVILGLLFGYYIAKTYKNIISKMAGIQEGSELYNKITSKLSVKILTKVIFGKNIAKIDWQKVQALKFRQPFRIWGVIVVAIVIALAFMFPKVIQTATVSNIIQNQLSKANGATVDYQSINIDLASAKLSIAGLAATNPQDLKKDRFYAKDVSAKISITDLLTKNIALDNVVLTGVSFDKARDTAGKLYVANTNATPTDTAVKDISDVAKPSSLDYVNLDKISQHANSSVKFIKGAKQGIQTLARFSNPTTTDKSSTNSETKPSVAPTNDPSEQASVYGYANVQDTSLRNKYPSFVIYSLSVNDYVSQGNTYDFNMTNISTEPQLLNKPTSISLKTTNNDDVSVAAVISNSSALNTVNFNFKGLNADALNGLNVKNVDISADKASVSGNGNWSFSGVNNIVFNLPIKISLQNVNINAAGVQQNIGNLTLDAVLSGDFNNVKFGIDQSSLANVINKTVVQNTAKQIMQKSKVGQKAQKIIDNTTVNGQSIENLDVSKLSANTTVNGKAIKNMNAKDVQNLASQFGVKF